MNWILIEMLTEENDMSYEPKHYVQVEMRKVETQAAIEKNQRLLVSSGNWRTCLNCEHFTEVTVMSPNERENKTYKHCGLYRAVPPPEVIVHGCKDWQDEIPF